MTCISLLHQIWRLRTASWFDSKQVEPNAKGLCYLDANSDIFITRQYEGIAYCVVPCQIDKVSDNQRVYALLRAFTVYRPKAEFGILRLGNSYVVVCQAAVAWEAIIPIDSQQTRRWSNFFCFLSQFSQYTVNSKVYGRSFLLLSNEQTRPLRV